MAIRWLFRCLAAGLGLAQIIVARNAVGPDSRSYIELAQAILRHDWAMTVNAYWSALYPWLLAAVLGAVRPSLRWEFPVAHALAFPVYLACIAAFEFFWGTLLLRRNQVTSNFAVNTQAIPSAQMWVLGYSLFIWLTVGDAIKPINPDLCLFTVVLLSAGLLMQIELTRSSRPALFLWFGICLGLGYLIKAILFPMAFVFLGVMAMVSGRSWRQRIPYFGIALLAFLALATPQIVLLSHAKGRVTFSDTGKLAYAWYTYDLPVLNWQGEPAWSGIPVHPTRKLYDHPAVYEFNGPLRSSYPPWYDPSYWNEGLSPRFQVGMVGRHVVHNIFDLVIDLSHPVAWLIDMFLILLGSDFGETRKGIFSYAHIGFISMVAFALYSLTLVQSRYLSPWELLFWGAVLATVRLRAWTAPLYRGLVPLVSLALVASMGYLVYGEIVHGLHDDGSAEYATAEGLKKMGLLPGEKVGAIGFDNDAYWAHLTRLDIVAEINTDDTCSFWSESPEIRTQVLEKFIKAGAGVVVANTGAGVRSTSRPVPVSLSKCFRPTPGWRQIPGSPNHAFFLK
jgi:hypothetical protein